MVDALPFNTDRNKSDIIGQRYGKNELMRGIKKKMIQIDYDCAESYTF